MAKFKCPFCGSEMLRYEGLPSGLDAAELIEDHPIPMMKKWASKKLNEIRSKVYYRRCPKCGLILWFEEVK